MKWIIGFSILLTLSVPNNVEASNVEITKDPMQDLTRLRYDAASKPYLIRGVVTGDRKKVQLYIVHSYYGDARYTTASVRWIDGTLKRPELYDVDTDFDCTGSRYLGCRKTIHKVIKITPESWMQLVNWSRKKPNGSLAVQLQSDTVGEVFDFKVDAEHISIFNEEYIKH